VNYQQNEEIKKNALDCLPKLLHVQKMADPETVILFAKQMIA